MLGSFQRAHKLLQAEVAKLRDAQFKFDEDLGQEETVRAELEEVRRACAKATKENEELQQKLNERHNSRKRDSVAISRLRERLSQLVQQLAEKREESLRLAQQAAEEERISLLQDDELKRLRRTEEALEQALMVQWEMLEDLARQFSLAPPWSCGLCSCKNTEEEEICQVCESPKNGKTDCGGRAVEVYFEFRFHQEFLGRDPAPEPERRLAALRIAVSHREEKWIEEDEVQELYTQLKDLANDESVDCVLRAEAAFVLFMNGDDSARRLGRMIIMDMGRTSDAVRHMCRRLRQQRVAILFRRLMELKCQDLERFQAWEEKLESAQLRFKRLNSVHQIERSSPADSFGSTSAGPSSPSRASQSDEQPTTSSRGKGDGHVKSCLQDELEAGASASQEARLKRAVHADSGSDWDAESQENDFPNHFPLSSTGVYSAAGFTFGSALWTSSQMSDLFYHERWSVGETWTLSAIVNSSDIVERLFGFSGGGGFLNVEVPAGACGLRIVVTDQVKQVTSKFMYRGRNGRIGDVFFTDIFITPGDQIPKEYS